ncbi:hypothetical protein [Dysgonomonas sp. 25]|uniref:hypothetical protein n=1 Tax=Dysgonomonas sp. 25 TaxID=2302933 RepID=UPI0013D019B7|nr:hypothetical protein [Dysgonomonas sp. 25]NDV68473.1 hypothetical protein [Dysgonomonas sp. 25]
MKYYFLTTLLSLIIFAACKPYNSTEKNKELLQGKWRLKEISYSSPGMEKPKELSDVVYLSFVGDTIIEEVNGQLQRKDLFEVKNYNLIWVEKGSSFAFQIMLLNDSVLSLKSKNTWLLEKEKAA